MKKGGDERKKSAEAEIGGTFEGFGLETGGGRFERGFKDRERKSFEIYAS